MEDNLYYYKSNLIRVIDGDSIEAMVDLGFSTWRKTQIRLMGIDTPEVRTTDLLEKVEGLKAKDFVIKFFENSPEFILFSTKVDKYGRCLGRVWLDNTCLNDLLLENGLAVPYLK